MSTERINKCPEKLGVRASLEGEDRKAGNEGADVEWEFDEVALVAVTPGALRQGEGEEIAAGSWGWRPSCRNSVGELGQEREDEGENRLFGYQLADTVSGEYCALC